MDPQTRPSKSGTAIRWSYKEAGWLTMTQSARWLPQTPLSSVALCAVSRSSSELSCICPISTYMYSLLSPPTNSSTSFCSFHSPWFLFILPFPSHTHTFLLLTSFLYKVLLFRESQGEHFVPHGTHFFMFPFGHFIWPPSQVLPLFSPLPN